MWECEKCKADVEDNFDVCWNCGSDKTGSVISFPDTGEQLVFEERTDEVVEEQTINQNSDLELLPAPKNIRFFNALIDTIAIVLITYFVFVSLDSADEKAVLLFWPFFAFIYYLLFESLFGVTLGKLVTQTRVINCLGEKPHFLIVFMRTLSRFIPFEAFTYLTEGEGWHGAFTGTYVIFRRYDWKEISIDRDYL